jgi:peptidoglycan/LPS O-acetylase OafA/YrhL
VRPHGEAPQSIGGRSRIRSKVRHQCAAPPAGAAIVRASATSVGERSPSGAAHERAGTPPLRAGGRIPELDGVRGIAIWLVLIDHFVGGYFARGAPGVLAPRVVLLVQQGWVGVDLFFVLSGFLIGGILLDSRAAPRYFAAFYRRRFYRIVPLYFGLFMLSLLALSGLIPFLSTVNRSDVPWWAFVTFTQNFWTAHGRPLMVPFMGVTWSLAVEEQFYVTAPLFVRFVREKLLPWVFLGLIILAPLVRLVLYAQLTGDARRAAPYELMLCRADALGLGVLAAMMLRKPSVWAALTKHRNWLYGAFGVLLAGTPYFIRHHIYQIALVPTALVYTWLALFFTCVIVMGVTQRDSLISRLLRMRWLMASGVIAYGLYMLHTVFGFYGHALVAPNLPRTALAEGALDVVCLALSVVFAKWSWKYFEKPLIDRGHARRDRPAAYALPDRPASLA